MSKKQRLALVEAMEQRIFFDASQLTEAIVSKTLPAAIFATKLTHGTVNVKVSNDSGVTQTGIFRLGIFIADGTLDISSGQFASLGYKEEPASFSLKNGQSKIIPVPLTIKPGELALGTDTLFAVAVDPTDAFSQSDPGPTLTVLKAPGPIFSDTLLSATPVYTSEAPPSTDEFADQLDFKMSIKNTGVSSKGKDYFAVYVSDSPTFDSSAKLLNGSLPLNLTIPHGGTRNFLVNFNIADQSAGTGNEVDKYVFVGVTDTAGGESVAGFPTLVKLAGPRA